ncbi:unnamed protein product, partial [Effrenium voratum]
CNVRRVLLLLVPSRAHLALRPFCAGNPNAQRALRLAGAEVQVLRVCCLCQGRRLKEEGFVSDELMQSGRRPPPFSWRRPRLPRKRRRRRCLSAWPGRRRRKRRSSRSAKAFW